jgi:hypothetical protein
VAQKVQVMLVDDVDGGEAAETVGFGLDGVNYEIDLSGDNAAQLRNALSTWVGHARRVGGRSAPARKRASRSGSGSGAGSGSGHDTAAIREWARQSGHKVSDRGRISAEVLAAYQEANA